MVRRTSNEATLEVLVRREPGAPVLLYDFEDGTEGWNGSDPGGWNETGATFATSTAWATEGSQSVAATVPSQGWFYAPVPGEPLDMSQYATISFDFNRDGHGSDVAVALKNSTSGLWCQAGYGMWGNAGETDTITLDVTSFSCDPADMTEIDTIHIWVHGGDGVLYFDNFVVA